MGTSDGRVPRPPVTELVGPGEVDALIGILSLKSATGLRNRAVIHVLYQGGLRLGELLRLACADVDEMAGELHIRAVDRRYSRVVSVGRDVLDAVGAWLVRRRALGIVDDAPLFCALSGRPLDPSYVRQLLPRVARRAGIVKKVSAEGLRRAHAVELVAQGVPVAAVRARLGHSRDDVTRRYLSRCAPGWVTRAEGGRPCATCSADLPGRGVEGILVVDTNGYVVDLNTPAEVLLGRARDDVLGRCLRDLGPFAVGNVASAGLCGALREGSPWRVERHPGDAGAWGSARIHPLGNGFVVLLCAPDDDRVGDALCDCEERYRAIVETAVDAILTIDDRGLIESVNTAAERLFGYRADELVGANVSVLMPEPYRSEHDGYLSRYRETGVSRIIGIGREVFGRAKDGTTLRLHLSVGEMTIAGQRKFTGILQDISERIRIEEELRRIEERTRILEEDTFRVD